MIAQSFLYNSVFFTFGLILVHFYHVPNEDVGYYVLPLAIGNFCGPLLLGAFFDTIGRRKMISSTFALSGILLMMMTAVLFGMDRLTAITQTIAWSTNFLLCFAGGELGLSHRQRDFSAGDTRAGNRLLLRRRNRARRQHRSFRFWGSYRFRLSVACRPWIHGGGSASVDCGGCRTQGGNRRRRQVAGKHRRSLISIDEFGMCNPTRYILLFASAGVAAIAALLLAAAPLQAAVAKNDLKEVGVTPPSNAALPLTLPLGGEDGAPEPIQFWLGAKPSVWVLADYTCETLCGPVISVVSDALAHSGLRPGTDFRLVVVGLDPKDTAGDAANMRQAQDGLAVFSSASYFLRGDANAIEALTKALGFHSVYDRDHDQFAHPAAAFVIAPDGRLARAIPGLAIDPATLRLALVDAGNGVAGTWTDHIRLLCYGYDPVSGTYTVAIGRILAASAAATIGVLALLIALLLRREHGPPRTGTNVRHFGAQSRTPTTE